ncbi:hypothetical protein AO501_25355 [Mycobacterium gordonae]|uniref:DUF2746 domain-containing protein n=1 Tax=Mycobacterium gordonae TaxID=1778 RepID=A0A0Q2Q6I3_MYCGO|nr:MULTISPECIES: DUF2746 domain-containing protein [Mycobacterium]KQH75605.1 hypothetical protein AO501_25355 [Mycobacterium gordonae]MDP7732073.1 DUF2746 domain-containing protein [Mycobacterium sp. TY813]
MIALAESVSQAVNTWPAVALAVVGVVGGWGTLIIKVWAEGRKIAATGDAVDKIKEQVTNGGSNLAKTVGEVKEMLTAQQSGIGGIRSDIGGIREDIGGIRGEIRQERESRVDLARTLDDRLKRLERPN